MKVYFRELTIEDIPAIKEISKDIWEGDDYIPYVIDEWLKDQKSMNYGTFKDAYKTKLIGFGRVKLYDNELAWLEGGRISVSYQGQGIGKKQLGYAIEYATKSGVKVVQYDTASDNLASISLAKYYGFKKKKCMDLVKVNSDYVKLSNKIPLKVDKFTAKDVRNIYNRFDIGPGDEICIGWSYLPIKYITDEYGSWIYNRDAILHKVEFGKSHDYELPAEQELWMIVYGKPKAAQDLIQFTIQNELETKGTKIFEVFCKPNIVAVIKEMGFEYYKDERFGVILFEKALM